MNNDQFTLLKLLGFAQQQALLYTTEAGANRHTLARGHMDELRAYLREATRLAANMHKRTRGS